MSMTDFKNNEIYVGEIVALVYYSGTLQFAKVHKIVEGKGIKFSFIDKRYISHGITITKWKSNNVICKLNGEICNENQTVDLNTGEIVDVQ